MNRPGKMDYLFGTLFVLSVAILTAVIYHPFIDDQLGDGSPFTHEQVSGQPFNLLHVANFVYAAEQGDFSTVDKYIRLGIDPNVQDHNQDTALMGASLNGHKKIVELLLKHEANPMIKNSSGYTAIEFARISGDGELTEVLAQSSSSIPADRALSSIDEE